MDFIRHSHADLVILDIPMPDLDRFEVFAKLNQIPGVEKIPVIVVNGSKEKGDIEAGMYQRGLTFSKKLINAYELLSAIKKRFCENG